MSFLSMGIKTIPIWKNSSPFYVIKTYENKQNTEYTRKEHPHRRQSILQKFGRRTDFIVNSKIIIKTMKKNNHRSIQSRTTQKIL